MSILKTPSPVKVVYSLEDIFNAVQRNVDALQSKMDELSSSPTDMTIVISVTQSDLKTKERALNVLKAWTEQGHRYLETPTPICDGQSSTYSYNATLSGQISSGSLVPKSELA